MSTVLTRQKVDEVREAIPIRRNFLSRLLTWYRAAIAEPETEREKADWQQNSF